MASAQNQWGTFYDHHEGERRATYYSIRLPSGFPINANTWQVVMQMKQAAPSNNSGGTPVIDMEVSGGRWRLRQSLSAGASSDSRELWSAPAQTGVWTSFAYDVTYSQNPSVGAIKVYIDLNGDGDFSDANERSSTFHRRAPPSTPTPSSTRLRAPRPACLPGSRFPATCG
jgi:Polysaccharide lyase